MTARDPKGPDAVVDACLGSLSELTRRSAAPEWFDSLVFRGMRFLPVALG